ncbi:uncharacterized protein TNCV_5062421 [Trichonephila clavipes]|nr:uncharacterized protein TNCV_5062421 [Trichonephila clavipes]
MVSWKYLCPTLRCRREAEVSPLLSFGWCYLSSVSPRRHCCRVGAEDKGCRVYPLDPHPDAVSLYSGCTPGKRRAWFCQMTGTLPPLLNSVVGRDTPERSCVRVHMDPVLQCPGKGLVLPNPNIDDIAKHSRFLILSLPNNVVSKKSPFATQKDLKGIGGDPKSVRKLHSGDLLIETASAVQLKSLLLAKAFLDSTLTVTSHKSLNCSRGVISESDLLCTSETEILKGLSDQGVTQEIKTNKNISYSEARKLIVPQPSQTYAQITKPTAISTTTQTDPNITKIICPPLQCLSPSSSMPAVSTSSSSAQAHLLSSTSAKIPTIQSDSLLPIPIPTTTTTINNNLNTSASSLETETRPLTTSNKFAALSTEIQPLVPLPESVPTTSNSEHSNAPEIPKCVKRNSRNRRKRPKVQKAEIEIKIAPHRPRKSAPTELTADDEDMIMYDVQAEELEPNPEDKFAMKECFVNNAREYMGTLTPTRFRKSRG